MSYPSLDVLKNRYPHVGVNVVSASDTETTAFETFNGKVIPYIIFKGVDIHEVETKIFRLYHWEETNKRLPLPFDISNAPRQIKEDNRGKHFAGKIWIMHTDTREKRRVDASELDDFLNNGYVKAGPRSK